MSLIYALDLIGVAVFAITGALVGREKRLDLFGVIVFGLVTCIGGGTLRDVLLGRTPVFWIQDPNYIWVGVLSSVITFYSSRRRGIFSRRFLLIADAVGLALFTVIGAQIALAWGTHPLIAVMLSVMTGVAGGITRDLLAGEIPLIFRKEVYASASFIGAILYVVWAQLMPPSNITIITSMLITTVARLISVYYGGTLPLFMQPREAPKP